VNESTRYYLELLGITHLRFPTRKTYQREDRRWFLTNFPSSLSLKPLLKQLAVKFTDGDMQILENIKSKFGFVSYSETLRFILREAISKPEEMSTDTSNLDRSGEQMQKWSSVRKGDFEAKMIAPGDHLLVSFENPKELEAIVFSLIQRAFKENNIVLFLVTREEERILIHSLKTRGIGVDYFIKTKELVIIRIDDIFLQSCAESFAPLGEKLRFVQSVVKRRGRAGLCIVGRLAAYYKSLGDYEKCGKIERFWHEQLPKMDGLRISLVCPYESTIPLSLSSSLEEVHSKVLAYPS
jgi:hypothetical protein